MSRGGRARTGSALGASELIGFAASGVSFGRHFTTAPLAPDTGSSEHALPATGSPRTGFLRRSPTGSNDRWDPGLGRSSVTLWSELGRAVRGETGFSGKWIPRRGEHVDWGCSE